MLSNIELGKYLKEIRERKDVSLREVEKLTKIGYSHLSMIENGKRNVTPALLKNLAKIYNVEYIDLYEKAGFIDLAEKEKIDNINKELKKIDDFVKQEKIKYQDESNVFPTSDVPTEIPVLGKISAGLPILASENVEGYEFAPSSYLKEDFEYFYLRVQGDSMNLRFPEGNLVLVQKQDCLENGEIGVFLIDGQDATVKKFRQDGDFVILDPMSTNPSNITQIYNIKETPVRIIGKVILHIGKV